MPPNRGFGLTLGAGEESTWGTPAARTNWVRLITSTLARRKIYVPKPHMGTLGATSQNRRSQFLQRDEVSGDIEGLLAYDDSSILLLKHALGAVATTGTGPYVHSVTLATPLPTGLTAELIKGTGSSQAEVFEGCKVQRGRILFTAGELARWTLSLMGETSAGLVSAGTPTYSSNGECVAHHQGGQFGFNSANYDYISAEITWNNQLAFRQFVGAAESKEFQPENLLEVQVRITRQWDGTALYAAHLAQTASDLTFSFTGTGNNALAVTLHNAEINEATHPTQGPGPITETLVFRGLSDGTDEGLKLAFTNDNASATAN